MDTNEPQRISDLVRSLGIEYAVITSVARDDLADGGAGVFVETVNKLKRNSKAGIELLVPDFAGSGNAIKQVVEARPDVIGHNIETVKRLSNVIRDAKASYETSLGVLQTIKRIDPAILTKSGIMVGLGETDEEVSAAMRDLRAAGVDILTIGQYLCPSHRNIPVNRYVTPDEFKQLEIAGYENGFKSVLAGPFVRSSFKSSEVFARALESQ